MAKEIEKNEENGIRLTCSNTTIVLQEMDARQFPAFPEVVGSAISFELSNIFVFQRRSAPLPLIFSEQGKSISLYTGGVERSIKNSAGSAYMGSKIFHNGQKLHFYC